MIPRCPLCGGFCHRTTIGRSSLVAITMGLFLIGCGVVVFVLIPVVGWVIGTVLIVVGLLSGGKRRKVMRCKSCKTIVGQLA